ncbi:hypothetical protein [Herbiconiux liangxiaofengii]|uniref:hypothetical protein n=1 Tax=Herbiconiux liangxiaofengii TaxID=3342795 RepID=UPI0035BA5E60
MGIDVGSHVSVHDLGLLKCGIDFGSNVIDVGLVDSQRAEFASELLFYFAHRKGAQVAPSLLASAADEVFVGSAVPFRF